MRKMNGISFFAGMIIKNGASPQTLGWIKAQLPQVKKEVSAEYVANMKQPFSSAQHYLMEEQKEALNALERFEQEIQDAEKEATSFSLKY